MTNIATNDTLLVNSETSDSLNKDTGYKYTNVISIKEDSYRLKKCYIVEISRSFIVRSSKALIIRRNYKELIFQLLKKNNSNYSNLIAITYNREYKFVIYRVVISTSREISNLSKALIKT